MTEIVSTNDVLGGKPRLAGHRISVLDIVDRYHEGRTPDEVASLYELDLGEVFSALAYYHEHPEEMRSWREHEVERRRTLERDALSGPDDLRDGTRSDEESTSNA